ncbi:MAG: hypothetical protein QOH61_36 [Chloroflexota bacterium]|jgi:hypothetical protein|nr:hypothetical protein [Chloroflexota bacterium]
MGELTIRVGDDLAFRASWVSEAPQSVDAIRALLPLDGSLIHCRWSGEGCWIPFGESFLDLGPENATSHPAPGEIIVYPGGVSECEILIAYGSVDFSSKVGQLWGNHFATIDVGAEQLREMGSRVLWQGAQKITIEER